MNLRDLERRKKQIKEEREEGSPHGHFNADVYVFYTQIETLDKLINIFSQKTSKPSVIEAEIHFGKIYGFQKQKAELTQIIRAQSYLDSQVGKNTFSDKILCFVGPPGVGKTAFAQAMAKILGRKFYLIPLSGKADADYLIGTMPTYRASKHGQIVEAILQTKNANPVILFDEVDKISNKEEKGRGGLGSTLLQILDPLQNKQFKDQYLDAEIDLSQATFILTANSVDELDPALKSRIEIIQLEGYSPQDKKHIAGLILNELFEKTYYLNSEQLDISDAAWEKLISLTNEEGVRQLKQGINKILIYCYDKWAEDYNNGHSPRKILVDSAKIEEIIPGEFFKIDKDEKKEEKKKWEERHLKEEKQKEELINLNKQWRNDQRWFMLGIGIFLLVAMIMLIINIKKKKRNRVRNS